MKRNTFITSMTVATCLLLGAAIQSFAQAPGGGQGRGGFGVLNEDQRTKLREAMQASQTELAPLNEKLQAAQKEALTAAMAKNPDEKALRAKIEAVQKIQTDIALLRLKAMKPVTSTLTDEQKAQLTERPGMGYMMFLGGGGGFGGGMRGGRGGGGGGGNQ